MRSPSPASSRIQCGNERTRLSTRRRPVQPASRTPEGESNLCPLCGAEILITPSRPPGDAPCPNCGNLLWFDRSTRDLVQVLTVGQAAKVCKVSQQTIIRCIDDGR